MANCSSTICLTFAPCQNSPVPTHVGLFLDFLFCSISPVGLCNWQEWRMQLSQEKRSYWGGCWHKASCPKKATEQMWKSRKTLHCCLCVKREISKGRLSMYRGAEGTASTQVTSCCRPIPAVWGCGRQTAGVGDESMRTVGPSSVFLRALYPC